MISCLGTPTGIAQIGSPFVNTADGILPTELKVCCSLSQQSESYNFFPLRHPILVFYFCYEYQFRVELSGGVLLTVGFGS